MKILKNTIQNGILVSRIRSRNTSRFIKEQTRSVHQYLKQNEKEAFHSVLPDVVNSIARHPSVTELPELEDWMKKILNYNLTGGKAARGQSVVTAYEILENPENLNEESMRLARILGWCVEMFQAYVLMLDDIMDGSTTRRGKPCWYRVPKVGVECALNDSILLYNGMFYLLRTTFGDKPNYAAMLNTINDTLLYSAFGQFLDLKTSKHSEAYKNNLFAPERYFAIIKYKSGYYSYDMPICLGYLLTGNKLEVETRKKIQDLSIELGTLFQIQDDYIDCYSDTTLIGKDGSDIQNGKCTWLAVKALQRCSDAQRLVFNVCYGSNEAAHIDRIKVLYDQLKLPDLYKEEQQKHYDEIMNKIKMLPNEEWKTLFNKLLGITYKRKK